MMCTATRTLACGLVAATLLAACSGDDSGVADADAGTVFPQTTCFWGGPYIKEDPTTDFALLDDGAVYWTSFFVLPEGARLRLHGRYAHARYQSLTAYNDSEEATDALNDLHIEPQPGSVNPFLPGAVRGGAQRDYVVDVLAQATPQASAREPNALYAAAQRSGRIAVIYRVYVPDEGRGLTGGVPLPEPDLLMADGSRLSGELACTAMQASNEILETTVPPEYQYRLVRDQPLRAEGFPAEDPAVWYKFFSLDAYLACVYFKACGGQPAPAGGVYNNLDNAYVYSFLYRGFGKLAVLRGQLPQTPPTASGDARMASAQLRYWSLCSYESYTQKVAGCLYDEQLPLDADRMYTIVVSAPADRPSNATDDCGVAWLAWSPQGDGLGHVDDGQLLLRNMLPSPDFAHAVQNVAAPGDEPSVMGTYLPGIEYMDRAGFEALGCGS